MKKKRRLLLNGYFTIEASLLLPVVTVLILVVCIICFYLYNSCVVYQACYISALRGSQLLDTPQTEVNQQVKGFMEELLDFQIYDYVKEYKVDTGILVIRTEAKAKVTNLFKVFEEFKDIEMSQKSSGKATITDPVKLIRMKY